MLIVSLRPGSRKLTAVVEIRVHRHTRRGVRPPRFARNPTQDRVDDLAQPSSHLLRSKALGPAPSEWKRRGALRVSCSVRQPEPREHLMVATTLRQVAQMRRHSTPPILQAWRFRS